MSISRNALFILKDFTENTELYFDENHPNRRDFLKVSVEVLLENLETPVENEMNYCPKCGKKLEVAE